MPYSEKQIAEWAEPQRIDQTVFGPQGNCQSACLAMLLDIPLESVPNFAQLAFEQDDNAAAQAQTDWLLARGFGIVTIVKWQALPWPPKHGFYIAGGNSKRGNRHGVVFKDGELWHDPHPDRTGIESVDDVDILYPLAGLGALIAAVRKETREECARVCEKRSQALSEDPNNGYVEGDTNAFVWTNLEAGYVAEELDEAATAIRNLQEREEGKR